MGKERQAYVEAKVISASALQQMIACHTPWIMDAVRSPAVHSELQANLPAYVHQQVIAVQVSFCSWSHIDQGICRI